jgi:hypothetical protein
MAFPRWEDQHKGNFGATLKWHAEFCGNPKRMVILAKMCVELLGRARGFGEKPSKQFQDQFGHTPLSIEEDVPWKCRRLVIGTGAYGKLPVMQEVRREAERRGIKLLILPALGAIDALNRDMDRTNAVLHVTC